MTGAAGYEAQLSQKTERFAAAFAAALPAPPTVYRSPPSGHRMRCEFRIWHDAHGAHYAMFEPGSKTPYTVDSFPPAAAPIQSLMPALLAAINAEEAIGRRLFRADFLCTLAGETLVTLVYHRPLDAPWEDAARALAGRLGISLIGRSKGRKVVIGQDHVTETLTVAGTPYRYRQADGGFTQPNASINGQMLAWASARARGIGGNLLELYCGNGNFTLPLAARFAKILATEVSKSAIASLRWGIEANGVANVQHARLSAEEVTQALDGVRPFRRLAHVDLESYDFSTVLVDPPRAGVDQATLALLRRFANVIYISCNPQTLLANLAALTPSHAVAAAALFDQFPFTAHLEAGLHLRRC